MKVFHPLWCAVEDHHHPIYLYKRSFCFLNGNSTATISAQVMSREDKIVPNYSCTASFKEMSFMIMSYPDLEALHQWIKETFPILRVHNLSLGTYAFIKVINWDFFQAKTENLSYFR